jgi:recombination associated protein RdgC
MFFRNLTLFRFPTSLDFSELDTFLPPAALKPVGPLEMNSRGFIPPFGRGDEAFSHRVGNAIWLSSGAEDKILPGAVVNEMLARKLDEIEEKEGRRPGGKTRKRLKDDLLHELLPRAFVKPSRTDALIDLDHGFIAVDSSSRKSGETVVSEVRRAMGSFPAMPLNAEVAPRAILTGWIAGEPLPEGLSLGDECEMKDAMEGGAVVKCQKQELRCEEIDKHLEAGKQVTKLALTLDDHVSFVLGDDLIIRKLKFLDGAVDELENTERDDIRAELDARFTLMSAEVRRMFVLLEGALKLSKVDG